jgi:hypothetical protein
MLMLGSGVQLRVEVRNSEVWLIRDGQESQLTRDEKAKLQAILAPPQDRIAYFEECPEAERCTPAVVILDLEGHRIVSFQPKRQSLPAPEPCASILSIVWVGNHAIGAECHINPSLNEYVETDLSTRQTTRDLLGFDFELSPDGQHVAHVGWMPHFAPPPAKSYYLQIDYTTVYPLPQGMSPVEQENASKPPTVVQQHGLTYSGIHQFASGLFWSPDSQRIALIDCTYDWTANTAAVSSAGEGEESNRRCLLAVVSPRGQVALFSLMDVGLNDLPAARLSWTVPRSLILHAQSRTRTFTVP